MRTALALLLGLLLGSGVNMLILNVGSVLVPLPDGTDPMDAEAIKAAMPRFTPLHFVFPFLAHAVGTLVGAIVAARVCARPGRTVPMVIAVLFLLGGIVNAISLPAPLVFMMLDLLLAYLPMGYLGWLLAYSSPRALFTSLGRGTPPGRSNSETTP